MRIIWLALLGAFLAVPALAQSAGAPSVRANDTWTYRNTVQRRGGWHQADIAFTVTRVESGTIALDVKQAGSPMPPHEVLADRDWSRTRSVNGHLTVVNRPLAFPLSVGKTWLIDYTEDHPNRQHSSEHFHTVYKVVGWEDVSVPAGTFHALKIEGEGQWSAAVAPAVAAVSGARVDAQGTTTLMQTRRITPRVATGRLYKAFWYVPAAKRWVKSLEEYYDSNGVRNEMYMDELESYKVSN